MSDIKKNEDVEIEYEDEVVEESGIHDKLKKMRAELKEAKQQSQEYLTGWQKERAAFANFKAEEEKKRKERIELLKTNLISDFFPVLDSFDMAFANKEVWESIDPNWRTGVEYIYTQFMNTLASYGVSVIDTVGVEFDPNVHDPVSKVEAEKEKDNTVISVIQKGYRAGSMVLRPAKVTVGEYKKD